ncbi:MAG: M48 family metallopeptidase [Christensenellaceae bacterium]|jgi:predicted metal-dependent hydrolase|nr:M48 family metallopeptidase [Christensenellaceae bacterium]
MRPTTGKFKNDLIDIIYEHRYIKWYDTSSIKVHKGKVIISTYEGVSDESINTALENRAEWIKARIQEQYDEGFRYGGSVLYRGQNFTIEGREGNVFDVEGNSFIIPLGLNVIQIEEACHQIYLKVGEKVLREKVDKYSKIMNLYPTSIKMSEARRKWGSCDYDAKLVFPWRLLMLEDKLIDYVIVHELAHIKEMDHSKSFWDVVSQVFPDHRKIRKELLIIQKDLIRRSLL